MTQTQIGQPASFSVAYSIASSAVSPANCASSITSASGRVRAARRIASPTARAAAERKAPGAAASSRISGWSGCAQPMATATPAQTSRATSAPSRDVSLVRPRSTGVSSGSAIRRVRMSRVVCSGTPPSGSLARMNSVSMRAVDSMICASDCAKCVLP